MTYELEFKESALKEWQKLDGSVRKQFKTALLKRLENPHVLSAKLRGMDACYKIKLRAIGYRLVYQVFDDRLVVTVVGVGKREGNEVYELAKLRL